MKIVGKKISKKIIILAILDSILVYFLFVYVPVFVKINGDKTVYVNVHDTYEDAGAISPITKKVIEGVGEVNTDVVGEYIVKYHNGIQTLKRKVYVVDNEPPLIKLNGGALLVQVNGNYEDPGYEVIDNYEVVDEVVINNNVDTSKAGNYQISYDVADSSGNQADTVYRNVYVVDDDYHYVRNINGDIDEELLKPIVAFMNNYYRIIRYLEVIDFKNLYHDNYEVNYQKMKSAIDLLVYYRQNSDSDLRLKDCFYDLNIEDVRYIGSGISKVSLTEDSFLEFLFIDGITSTQSGLVNEFYLIKDNDEYKITNIYHEEAFYLYFDDNYVRGGIEAINDIYTNYKKLIDYALTENKNDKNNANNSEVVINKAVINGYDRNMASEYAVKYGNKINNNYIFFEESNCVNFVSQCLYAGGIKMDSTAPYIWKYYDGNNSEAGTEEGYSISWTYIPSFNEYLDNGDIFCEKDLNIYYGEEGDIISVDMQDRDYDLSPHVVLISKQIRDKTGDILDLLICGNTNNQVNMPLSAIAYPYKKLIKIYGTK